MKLKNTKKYSYSDYKSIINNFNTKLYFIKDNNLFIHKKSKKFLSIEITKYELVNERRGIKYLTTYHVNLFKVENNIMDFHIPYKEIKKLIKIYSSKNEKEI